MKPRRDRPHGFTLLEILVATIIAGLLATLILLSRNRYYADLYDKEEADEDHDGIPDVYQTGSIPAVDSESGASGDSAKGAPGGKAPPKAGSGPTSASAGSDPPEDDRS